MVLDCLIHADSCNIPRNLYHKFFEFIGMVVSNLLLLYII